MEPDGTVAIRDLTGDLRLRQDVRAVFARPDGSTQETALLCRVDTDTEIDYLRHGDVLHYVLRQLSGDGGDAGARTGRWPCREDRPEPAVPAGGES